MKPNIETRNKLINAGKTSHDPLDVMNAFYCDDRGLSREAATPETRSVFNEYWQLMVAVLCERVVKAEQETSKQVEVPDAAKGG